jgi:type IV secretion system protein VirB5
MGAALGDTPGPIERAALDAYYERGSKSVIDRNRWRTFAIVAMAVIGLQAVGIASMLPLKTVETVWVGKAADGAIVTGTAEPNWKPDETLKMAAANEFVSLLTEINLPTWERNTGVAMNRALGVARNQIEDYKQRAENNPAVLTQRDPLFVREFGSLSVNLISPQVALVRYTLTDRPRAGTKIVRTFAATVNFTVAPAKSKAQAIANPYQLAVTNFNITEEAPK